MLERGIQRPALMERMPSCLLPPKHLGWPPMSGPTHVIFEPLDFMAKLAALVPKPRVNLTRFHVTRFHGVFAPNSHHRMTIAPSKRGKGAKRGANTEPASLSKPDARTPMERRAAMTWARRLKRVFNIDISEYEKCKGPVKVIACIEQPIVIEKILNHLKAKEANPAPPSTQLPPQWNKA
jgi:hypothetical protein